MDRAAFQRYQRIDHAFKAGDLQALRAALDDPEDFPNTVMTEAAMGCSVLQ